MKKDILVIVNPASAGGRTGRGWPGLAARLRQAGLDFDSELTEGPAQATAVARKAIRDGRSMVVAVGGDGTVNEVASGFFEGGEPIPTESRMGVVPVGTGGDFRRTFGIPSDVDQAAGALARGRCRRIDAGRITYRRHDGSPAVCHFVNIASAGIGGEVVHRVNSGFKLISGEITFTLASALVLLSWRNKPMRVVVDGDLYELVAQQVVVANCQYYGGGMRVAPRALPDDGLFDVVIAGDLGLLENVRLLGPIRRGAHLEQDHGKMTYRTARRVEVTSSENVRIDVDGEQPGVLPATFEMMPATIDLVVP